MANLHSDLAAALQQATQPSSPLKSLGPDCTPFAKNKMLVQEQYKALGEDVSGLLAGPVPLSEWFTDVMRCEWTTDKAKPFNNKLSLKGLSRGLSENQAYKPFVSRG